MLFETGQILVCFYAILYRTTTTAALQEVERTRAFVSRIPYHVLTSEVPISKTDILAINMFAFISFEDVQNKGVSLIHPRPASYLCLPGSYVRL